MSSPFGSHPSPLRTPAPSTEAPLRVTAWEDPGPGGVGLDPRSPYVETFWLPVLGPSATWLLRRLADRLEDDPGGYHLDPVETAAGLGLVANGRHSSFHRALGRLIRFSLCRQMGPGAVAMRRSVPPLNDRHVVRLPPALQVQHRQWQAWQAARESSDQHRRALDVARSIVQGGEHPRTAERRLRAWGAHPALAYEGAEESWRPGPQQPS